MPGMQFEYDEEGGTFFYFLFSFWGLVLIPCTYYFWPRKQERDDTERKKRECKCEACLSKRQRLKSGTKWQSTKQTSVKVVLFIGWVIFIALAYKVSKIQLEYVEYDPYAELDVDRGASQKEIRKAYKAQSLKYHPDKETGDHKKFMRIAKAYAALTDEETKKNWEEFGNPDGPGVTKFGIALPKWIVEQENSAWVLAAYGLVFMVIMPVAVGIWWYRSIKYSKDEVLLDTTRLYYYFFQKVPNMLLKRVVMVLGASFEFDRFHNQEISERPSDNEEVPQLMKRLPNLDEKNKEKPLCFPYSVKARALLHAHFQRLDLPPNTLEVDKQYVLKKTPCLINEMVNITAQLVAGAARNAIRYMPRLETVENCMKVSQMVFQALDQKSSPLLQLPHITPDMLKHFVTRKRNIQRIRDFTSMKEEDKRALLRNLTNDEYRDIINVCATLPYVKMIIKSEVLDDEDSSITAGSIVTVTVELERKNMEVLFDKETFTQGEIEESAHEEEHEHEHEENTEENGTQDAPDSPAKKNLSVKVWEKQKKKVVKKGGKQKKKTKQAYNWKAGSGPAAPTTEKAGKEKSKEGSAQSSHTDAIESKAEDENEGSGLDTDEETNDQSEAEETEASSKGDTTDVPHEDDEEQWKKYQEEAKKEQSLETKAKESHPVHCPHFPEDKQEGWWLYVADKKNHMLITAPVQILTLKDTEEIQLKFSAPARPGNYTYTVFLRSDCYFDFDQSQNMKLDVKEAKVIEAEDHWEISDDDEDKDKEEDSDSDYSTDIGDSDED